MLLYLLIDCVNFLILLYWAIRLFKLLNAIKIKFKLFYFIFFFILLQIEFDVQMTCQKCVDSIRNVLSGMDGVTSYDINLDQGSVLVDTNLPYSKIQEAIEQTGRKAVLKGYGGKSLRV